MKLIENIDEITDRFQNSVVTIGNFDGVHKGHQALLTEVCQRAQAMGGTSIAVTFDPHPLRVLKSDNHVPQITLYEQKIELLAAMGIDVTICIPFTKSFAEITAEDFVQNILLDRLGMKVIVVGKDYTFGRNRKGNIQFLKSFGERSGFDVIVKDWERLSGESADRISSTRIREVVMDGDVDVARDLLGRYYQIRGRVVRGRDRGGKQLGFPTANIHLQDELCPKSGVYAVTVTCKYGRFMGVANIGYSPTFDDHIFTVEVHILNFGHDLYDEIIRVNFIRRLRDEKKFNGISELSEQINKDIQSARQILSQLTDSKDYNP